MNANDPVFPGMVRVPFAEEAGLTKREYFAGLVMQGLIASGKDGFTKAERATLVNVAVFIADDLLHELAKKQDDAAR